MVKLTPDETLLGLLAIQAQHGYQLLDCFRDPEELGEVWTLSTSQLYAVLKRLEQQQLIAGTQIASPDAPPRTVYSLTGAGRARLDAWLYELQPSSSVRRVRVEFLSRLYVARRLKVPLAPIIHSQRDACAQKRDMLAARRDQFKPGIALMALDMMIAQLDALLDWIDRCEQRLIDRAHDVPSLEDRPGF